MDPAGIRTFCSGNGLHWVWGSRSSFVSFIWHLKPERPKLHGRIVSNYRSWWFWWHISPSQPQEGRIERDGDVQPGTGCFDVGILMPQVARTRWAKCQRATGCLSRRMMWHGQEKVFWLRRARDLTKSILSSRSEWLVGIVVEGNRGRNRKRKSTATWIGVKTGWVGDIRTWHNETRIDCEQAFTCFRSGASMIWVGCDPGAEDAR